jgi:hypothetical protein
MYSAKNKYGVYTFHILAYQRFMPYKLFTFKFYLLTNRCFLHFHIATDAPSLNYGSFFVYSSLLIPDL